MAPLTPRPSTSRQSLVPLCEMAPATSSGCGPDTLRTNIRKGKYGTLRTYTVEQMEALLDMCKSHVEDEIVPTLPEMRRMVQDADLHVQRVLSGKSAKNLVDRVRLIIQKRKN